MVKLPGFLRRGGGDEEGEDLHASSHGAASLFEDDEYVTIPEEGDEEEGLEDVSPPEYGGTPSFRPPPSMASEEEGERRGFAIPGVPPWLNRVLIGLALLLVIGLVPALGLSWIYELTPEGIKRDAGTSTDQAATAGLKLNWATLVVALLAIGLLVYDRLSPGTPTVPQATVEAQAIAGSTAQGAASAAASASVTPCSTSTSVPCSMNVVTL